MSKIKLALVLHGLVGSMKGKNGELNGGSARVLELSAPHNRRILENYTGDVFYHTWSTECIEQLETTYSPTHCKAEPQIEFEVPDFIKANPKRAFAHLSRWYSFWKAMSLVSEYISTNPDVAYTHVLVQRFDLCWNVMPRFEQMDPLYFWVGKSTLDVRKEWSDRWFCSSVSNMQKFAQLYNEIPNYMAPGGPFTSKKQYGGISSHFLAKYHAEREELVPKFKYIFGGYNSPTNDYNEVRRQYGGDDR